MSRSFRPVALLLLCLAFAFASAPSSTRAVDDEFPTCEEVSSCVVFDPAAAAPGATVTITPGSEDFIPRMSECSPEGRLWIELLGESVFTSPLVGDDQLARFTVPEMPPGEYEAALFCSEIEGGPGVGVFRVLAVGATPTPTPEATPTPTPAPTPTPTPVAATPGDEPSTAIPVSAGTTQFDSTAMTESAEDPTSCGEFEDFTNTMWFSYTAARPSLTRFDVNSFVSPDGSTDFLVILFVYEQAADGTLTEVGCSEDPDIPFLVEVQPGTTYLIAVAALDAEDTGEPDLSEHGGTFDLTIDPTAPAAVVEIWVFKGIDADGNLDTVDDWTFPEGWEFELELTDGTIEEINAVTDETGFAFWLIGFGPDGTTATLAEVPQEGFELFDASCLLFDDEAEIRGEPFELDGDSVTFQVDPEIALVHCNFWNAPSPEGGVGGETATPPSNTLPPTDAGGSTNTLTSGSWRVVLVVLAGILAASLVSIPDLGTRRTASRRR